MNCMGAPKFPLKYELVGNIIELAPSGYLFNENDRAKFTSLYFRAGDRHGTYKIRNILNIFLGLGKDVVLLC